MSNIFERDYQMLELDRDSSWADARVSYKRLVNRWHPDRFNSRPREKQHAQSRFIEITKSYNELRAFHRLHNRLPLQNSVLKSSSQSTGVPPEPPEPPKRPASVGGGAPNIEDTLSQAPNNNTATKKPRYWLWLTLGLGVTLIGVIVVFITLEKSIAAKQREAAIEVLRSTQPSEFLRKR